MGSLFQTPTKPKRFAVKKKKKQNRNDFGETPFVFAYCTHPHHRHSVCVSIITSTTRPEPKTQFKFLSLSLSLELISVPRERLRENERRLRGLAFSIRRRSLHSRLDLLQSPLLSLSFSIFHFNQGFLFSFILNHRCEQFSTEFEFFG